MQFLLRSIANAQTRLGMTVLVAFTALLSCSPLLIATAQDAPTGTVESAPTEPVPAVVETPIEPAPVVPAPVEPLPVMPAPVAPAPVEPAPVIDDGAGEVVVPPAPPVELPTATIAPTQPSQDVNPGEPEDDASETSGSDPTAVPSIEATVEPAATEASTQAPATPATTATPSPTPEPTPLITWSQPEQITCELRDGNTPGLKYQESNRYHCRVTVNVASDIAMPADMKIEWTLDVAFPDAYVLEFPAGSLASVKTQLPTSATSTQYTVSQPWKQGSGQQNLAFEVVISRNTCAIGEQALTVQAIPTISAETSKAEIQFEGVQPQVKNLTSPVIASEQPSVAFEGQITFQSLNATSTGLESNLTTGTATIVVTGDWDPCQEWTLDLSGTVDVSTETPAVLSAVSINQEPISGDVCNLPESCDLIVLPATGDAATPLRYTIGMELELHQFTPVGDVGLSLQAGLTAVETQP